MGSPISNAAIVVGLSARLYAILVQLVTLALGSATAPQQSSTVFILAPCPSAPPLMEFTIVSNTLVLFAETE